MTAPAHNSLSHNVTKLMVGGAVCAAIIMAVHYGWGKGTDVALSIAFVIVMVSVALGEVLCSHNLASSFYERRPGAMVFWGLLGCALSTGTFYTNFSTAAGSGEKVAVVKTAEFNNYDAVKSDLASDRAKLARLEGRLSWMSGTAVRGKPVGTVEGADAKIAEANAHRFWKMTDGCKETKGPQTREFCANFAAAKEEYALAVEKKAVESEIPIIKARIAKNAGLATEKVSLSDDAANITAVAAWLKVDTKTARQADSMLLGILVQAMMLLGGILLATETYRHLPRKPWFTGKITLGLARLWSLFTGAHTTITKHTVSMYDPTGVAQAEKMARA